MVLVVMVLAVVGLFGAAIAADAPDVCRSSTAGALASTPDGPYSLLVYLPSGKVLKAYTYSGTFTVKEGSSVEDVIIQARPTTAVHSSGYFPQTSSTVEVLLNPGSDCYESEDTLVTGPLQSQRYTFLWTSDPFRRGDIVFWYAVKTTGSDDYVWYKGPTYQAKTENDAQAGVDHKESTTHKIYYIVVPAAMIVLVLAVVMGGLMVVSKVKYGTIFCCFSNCGTPISYRYARKYRVQQRGRANGQASPEAPPSYDNTVSDENRAARQKVARFELLANHNEEEEDAAIVSDDHQPLTGP